eukprot:5159525-Prymnesium_polylepis.1
MKGKFSDADAPQPWKLDVMGARILCFEEPPPDRSFDGKLICKLSGGGVVTGRLPYGQNVSYLPTYRLAVAAKRTHRDRPGGSGDQFLILCSRRESPPRLTMWHSPCQIGQ